MIETKCPSRETAVACSIREHYKWLKHMKMYDMTKEELSIREHYKWLKHPSLILYILWAFSIREHYKWLKRCSNFVVTCHPYCIREHYKWLKPSPFLTRYWNPGSVLENTISDWNHNYSTFWSCLYKVLENTISDWNYIKLMKTKLSLIRIREHYKWLKQVLLKLK